MAMQINIQINADTEGTFTPNEQAVLTALAGTAAQDWPPAAATTVINTPAPAAAEPAEEPKPAPKRRAPKAKAASTRAAVLEDDEPEVEEEAPAAAEPEAVEDEADDLLAEEAPAADGKTYTTRDALNAATPLVTTGAAGRAKVKEALSVVPGAKKVSDLKESADIAAFLAALEG